VLAASNCDMALTLLIAALELPRGSRAVLPSYSYPSALHAIEWNGLQPHFVDVDSEDWCLHAEQLDGQLDGASLLLGTHMYGVPSDVEGLAALAEQRGIALVFDAAQAAATWLGERHVCDFGDATAISLSATKIVTAAEGGIAVIRDPQVAARFERLRRSGMNADGTSERLGLNGKLSELHAALGTITLGELEQQVSVRQALVDAYRRRLTPLPGVALQRVPDGSRPTPCYLAVELADARGRVQQALAARGIESRRYFPALHLMPRLAGISRAPLATTERLDGGLLALPLHAGLRLEDVEEVCETIAYELGASQIREGK